MNRNLIRLNYVLGAIVLALLIVLGILLSRPRQPAALPAGATATNPTPPTSLVSPTMSLTASPLASPTIELAITQADLEFIPLFVPTVAGLSSTPVPFVPPAAGNETFSLPSGVAIREEHTLKGMFLTLTGDDLPVPYRLGPLARGAYAIGPNQRFMVYITNAGQVYALRLGRPHFLRLVNLKHDLSAGARDVAPSFRLSFVEGEYAIFVLIDELIYGQRLQVMLPRGITD